MLKLAGPAEVHSRHRYEKTEKESVPEIRQILKTTRVLEWFHALISSSGRI